MRIFVMSLLMFTYTVIAVAGSRDIFVQNILPKKYPQLVKYLQSNGALPVTWTSQTGEPQRQTVELSEDGGVIIKTKMYGGPADNMNRPVRITMIDTDQDARLDLIEYSMKGQSSQRISNPADERSLLLWDTALAITMKYSACCEE